MREVDVNIHKRKHLNFKIYERRRFMAKRSKRQDDEIHEDILELETSKRELLFATRSDPVISAAEDVVAGGNVLFKGETGNGKTIRASALRYKENYQKMLSGTALEGITVKPVSIEIDMVPILAAMELTYEKNIEGGTSSKEAAMLAEFILKHGFASKEQFLEHEQRKLNMIEKLNGEINPFIVFIDDFDRVIEVGLSNAFMKFIENHEHYFSLNGETRWLNLQCVASSNSDAGRPVSGYLASRGIDLAIANRFQIYHISRANFTDILKSEYPVRYHKFIDKIVALVLEIKGEMEEGAFAGIGEITMRQIRHCVKLVAFLKKTELSAASRLLTGISSENEERLKADMLIEGYFGENNGAKNKHNDYSIF